LTTKLKQRFNSIAELVQESNETVEFELDQIPDFQEGNFMEGFIVLSLNPWEETDPWVPCVVVNNFCDGKAVVSYFNKPQSLEVRSRTELCLYTEENISKNWGKFLTPQNKPKMNFNTYKE